MAPWGLGLEQSSGAFDGLPGPLRSALVEEHNPLALTCTGFIRSRDQFEQAAQRDGKAQESLRGGDLFLAALALSWVEAASLADESPAGQLRAMLQGGHRG